MRQQFPGLHKRGHDISLDNMKKIAVGFKHINFCGQMGDPIYHPKFLDILEICKHNYVSVSTAGQGKKADWFEQAALISPKQQWIFGLDGLPHQSHLYRINQDGEAVFACMKRLSELGATVIWQYIVFKYNQENLEEAKKLASDNGINIVIIESSRWDEPYDKYKPDFLYKNRPKVSV
jgi:MoaA/NifB/PqqE/SkfB family radical SAM enzyme